MVTTGQPITSTTGHPITTGLGQIATLELAEHSEAQGNIDAKER